ncbi:uncharacterized protein LOC112692181 [Sipha flava]|uniref:Uncharacterized protein LOC112692181 n=1 Tax=Sipha flava TaxID=143950 RepID=A0A8B8GIX1_9HEMI|nr:uncharacterized protein LOC112692181 [Sipha flava]
MVNNIIPQEDNTSEILKADLLKYDYINKRNKIKKQRTNANPANRQEKAIRLLKEERHNLEIKLKTITCNKNVKDGEKYKAKFAQLIREIKKSEIEFNEERKIEMEIDKEILRLEIGQNKPENRIKMGNVKKIVFGDMNIEYNKLINEQNQLRVKAESALKRLQQVKMTYNSLMYKLDKGQRISFVLSEEVKKIQKQRESKKPEKFIEQNTKLSALNAEAKEFIKYLIYIADEQNLEKVMEIIIKMDLDNQSMFEFLIALDLHVTEAENAIERSRTSVVDRARVLSDMRAAKTEQLASLVRAYKSGRALLREACRASRLMAAEWRRTCRAVDEMRDLMMDASDTLDRGLIAGDTAANDGEDDANASGRGRRPPISVDELVAYFIPVERRLDEVLYRVLWTQDNLYATTAAAEESEEAVAGESMSTGSEQGDEFVVHDLDGYNNRQAKILAATDPNAVELEFKMEKFHVTQDNLERRRTFER